MPTSLKTLQRYHYDPMDCLTGTSHSNLLLIQRFYQGNYLVTELEKNSQRTFFRHEAQPLAQHETATASNETTLMVTDRAYTLLHSSTQSETQNLAYTAYGHRQAESCLSRLFGYNGELPDLLTGHYLLGRGNRAFNPVLMRFNSPDTLSPFGQGGINTYAYCMGDPVNYYDPTGNMRFANKPHNPIPRTSLLLAPTIHRSATTADTPAPLDLSKKTRTNISQPSSEPLQTLRSATPELDIATLDNLQQAGPSHPPNARGKYKRPGLTQFEIRFGADAEPRDFADKLQRSKILELDKQLKQSNILPSDRRILLQKRTNIINRVKSTALHKLRKITTTTRTVKNTKAIKTVTTIRTS